MNIVHFALNMLYARSGLKMAGHRAGDKPLPESILARYNDACVTTRRCAVYSQYNNSVFVKPKCPIYLIQAYFHKTVRFDNTWGIDVIRVKHSINISDSG